MADETTGNIHNEKSASNRLTIERLGGYLILGLVAVYGCVGLWSDTLAHRVVALAPALATLATVLGGVMGASWFRGHMDNRIDGGQ